MSDEYVTVRLHQSLEALLESIRELLAASALLRSRIESQDALIFRLQNSEKMTHERLTELDRRITALENQTPIRKVSWP